MSKQAFLIIAHDNFSVLEKLIKVLSYPRVDIYVHIDAKVKELPSFLINGPRLFILNNRIDTRWGDVSQIKTEYALLREAIKKGGYSHYHIISGTHFPLKPIDTIVGTFDQWEGKTVFFWLCRPSKHQEELKLRRYNLFTRHLASDSKFIRRISQVLRERLLSIQSFMKIERNRKMIFYKASNWASLSEDAVNYLLEKETDVMRVFKYSFCGDEFFVPTLLMNNSFKDSVVNYNKYLFIKMGVANPRTLTLDDYEMLANSNCLFARKFSDSNIDLVDEIIDKLL